MHELATLRRRSAPPLMGLACLPEYSNRRASVPIGFAHTPSAVVLDHRSSPHSALGYCAAASSLYPRIQRNPLAGFSLPSEYHRCATARPTKRCTEAQRSARSRSFRGSFPFSVFPVLGSHLSHPCYLMGLVTSSGFFLLLTFCSPQNLASLFHLASALGVFPSRFSSLLGVVHISSMCPSPLRVVFRLTCRVLST